MTGQALRRNIMVPLGIILALLVTSILYGVYRNQRDIMEEEVRTKRDSTSSLYSLLVKMEEEAMRGYLLLLKRDKVLIAKWKSGDRADLYNYAKPIYDRFNQDYHITHFYFMDPAGKVDLRVHTPDRNGDTIERFTLSSAMRSGRSSSGVEMGPLGTFTLRVVMPIEEDGVLLGYMELGEEIGHITEALRKNLNQEVAVLVKKEFVHRADWNAATLIHGRRTIPWDELSTHVAVDVTRNDLIDLAKPSMDRLLNDAKAVDEIFYDQKYLSVNSVVLRDASMREVGSLLLFFDETDNHTSLDHLLKLAFATSIGVSCIIFLYFYVRIGREETKVKEEHYAEMIEQSKIRLAEQQQYIAELKQAREVIEGQSEFLQLIIDTIPVPIFYKNSDGIYLGCNKAFEEFFGMVHREVLGHSVSEIFPDGFELHQAADEELYGGKEVKAYEAVMDDAHGDKREMFISKASFIDPKDGTIGIVSAMFDMTENKEAKRELARNGELLRSIFDNAGVGIAMIDADGGFIRSNEAFCRMLDLSESDLAKISLFQLLAPDLREDFEDRWRIAAMKYNQVRDLQFTLSGARRSVTVNLSANWVGDGGGGLGHAVAVIQDIGEKLEAEKARDLLAKAVDCADEAILITDSLSRILYVNPSFLRVTGYDLQEVLGKTPAILKSGRVERELYEELWKTITSGEVWRGKFINRKKNGELFHEAAAISPVRDGQGNVVNFVSVKRDITRETELEASLRQAQKMEAVGTLASGVSHDFNNILHAITGFAQVLLTRKKEDSPDIEYLRLIMETASRGGDLVGRILTFSRSDPQLKRPLDLNREIAEIIKMVSKALPKNISFELELAADLNPIDAMSDQIQQIVMNLCSNASD